MPKMIGACCDKVVIGAARTEVGCAAVLVDGARVARPAACDATAEVTGRPTEPRPTPVDTTDWLPSTKLDVVRTVVVTTTTGVTDTCWPPASDDRPLAVVTDVMLLVTVEPLNDNDPINKITTIF